MKVENQSIGSAYAAALLDLAQSKGALEQVLTPARPFSILRRAYICSLPRPAGPGRCSGISVARAAERGRPPGPSGAP